MSTLTAKIQLRRDTAANWATNDPILAAGEVAFTSDVFYSGTDQQRFKIGDGVQTWSQLDYVPEGGGGTSVVFKNTALIQGNTNSVFYSVNLTGKITANDFINLKMRISTTSTAATKTIRVYINSSNTIIGATHIAIYQPTTSTKLFERDLIIDSTNQNLSIHTVSSNIDNITGSAFSDYRMQSINFNLNANIWMLFEISNITTETFYVPYIIMTKQ